MQTEGGMRGRWPRDSYSRGGDDGVGGIASEDWRVPHPEQSWNDCDWREWDKKHGHILWMGSIQVRER